MGTEHTYFKGDAIENELLVLMFKKMFNGRSVEQDLVFQPDKNSYKLDS